MSNYAKRHCTALRLIGEALITVVEDDRKAAQLLLEAAKNLLDKPEAGFVVTGHIHMGKAADAQGDVITDWQVRDISLVNQCPYCGTNDWSSPVLKTDGSVCTHPTKLPEKT